MKYDLISRQAAIDALKSWDWQDVYPPILFRQLLEKLPSAQPEREKGEWFWDGEGYSCSNCDRPIYGNLLEITIGDFKYCPFCGADMRGDKDE